MLLIGSHAAKRGGLDLRREPPDVDLIVPPQAIMALERFLAAKQLLIIDDNHCAIRLNNTILELEVAWPGSTGEELINLCGPANERVMVGDGGISVAVAPLNVLLALKLSHRYYKNSPHFFKTMSDIRALRAAGASAVGLEDLISRREVETYRYLHPKLKQSKKDFFSDDGIQYFYDHDAIHEAVKHLDVPAYRLYEVGGEEVLSSKKKFDELPREAQLYGVLEEAYVLALERSQVPFRDKKLEPELSFNIALMKVCTSITSGWFREFAWENYHSVATLYDDEYAARFFEKADRGEVKLHQP